MGGDQMRAIGASKQPLEAAVFETLHPDGDTIGIPIEDFHTIESPIEEHRKFGARHMTNTTHFC
jgi:hypothetical protein